MKELKKRGLLMGFYSLEQINNSVELQEQYKKEYGNEYKGLCSQGLVFEEDFKGGGKWKK